MVLQIGAVPLYVRRAGEFAWRRSRPSEGNRYGREHVVNLAGVSGFVATILGIVLGLLSRSRQIASIWLFEVWMFGSHGVLRGIGCVFLFVYGDRKKGFEADLSGCCYCILFRSGEARRIEFVEAVMPGGIQTGT